MEKRKNWRPFFRDVKTTIEVATPPDFTGGIPDIWSPEHLFLGSLSSCFMTTYLAIAEKSRLNIARFECNVIGQVELLEGHFEFTTINLFPKIFVAKDEAVQLGNEVLTKAYRHCIIANSIRSHVVYHNEVLVDRGLVKKPDRCHNGF